MDTQTWIIKAQIKGNFFLTGRDEVTSTKYPHPNVRKLLIKPQLNESEKFNGLFDLDIYFIVEGTDKYSVSPNEIADMGRNILNTYINLLTFLSGCPVRLIRQPSLTYNIPNTNKSRTICFGTTVNMPPAVPLLDKHILSIGLDAKKSRIITWLRKGIEEVDPINSLLALLVSIEVLAEQFPCKETRIRTCNKCGNIDEMEPGTRQKVHNLLVNIVGYNEEQFKLIWDKTRNEILHGKFDITSEIKRDLHKTKDELIIAVLKGTKRLLNIGADEFPRETPPEFSISDSFLDVTHTAPEKNKATSPNMAYTK